jgi:hypothetical protein
LRVEEYIGKIWKKKNNCDALGGGEIKKRSKPGETIEIRQEQHTDTRIKVILPAALLKTRKRFSIHVTHIDMMRGSAIPRAHILSKIKKEL